MSYNKKTYANTDETVTYEDMNRIEQGIYDNDVEISNMKDPSKEGSIAKQIADNAEQINVLKDLLKNNGNVELLNGCSGTLNYYYDKYELRIFGNVKIPASAIWTSIAKFPKAPVSNCFRFQDVSNTNYVGRKRFVVDISGSLGVAGTDFTSEETYIIDLRVPLI